MMLAGKKLLFIGAGNMAEALMAGLLKAGSIPEENIFFTEIREERRAEIERKLSVKGVSENRSGVIQADIVLFAVKPKDIPEVLKGLAGIAASDKVFITIAAGIPIRRFEEGLGGRPRVIRVMPNMAALVGSGISGVSRGRFATQADEDMASELMRAVGEAVCLPEELLDAVTALSGSGPAYFFYFAEALQESGVALGLDPSLSAKLVQATALGSALLMRQGPDTPSALRARVTSPGGTTESAMKVLQEGGFRELVIRAIRAAEARSKELRG